MGKSPRVVINGQSYDIPDNCDVSIINGVVYVNNQPYAPNDSQNRLQNVISFEGSVGSIVVDHGSVQIHGPVNGSINAGGNVSAGKVTGNVKAGGNVSCADVMGDVKAGGSVMCHKI